MPTRNREVFQRDPLGWKLPNDGVAKVGEPDTNEQRAILRYELQQFVCEGEYERGLDRILSSYLSNLGKPTQPAVWVSGFFGSGKSHLVRVLEYLWRDYIFPDDGRTARDLVDLTPEIKDHLIELSNAGKQRGGLWSAAGMLGAGAGPSIRLALLSVLFASAGLPTDYPAARFVLWLKQNGYYDRVRAMVDGAGRTLEYELRNLYVSPHIARAVVDCIPDIATSPDVASDLIARQFPDVGEIDNDEFVAAMRDVLEMQSTTPGKLPCTLIVLDEMQQFINDDADRALQVQTVVEACVSEFGSSLLVVATGQASLEATPVLEKLRDRYTVSVMLSDRDVEQVVRQVVLRKQPSRVPQLRDVLDRVSGQIDRQLIGTKIAPTFDDRESLVPDYPLLPVRHRFWERVLRAVDPAGKSGQLRTQLRIVHEATQAVADEPLGTVIAGDRIYTQIKNGMQQNGVLLRELSNTIDALDDNTPDGRLRTRLCGTIFLISKLPSDGPLAAGIRATPETLADLLVENLVEGATQLRQRIPVLLDDLVERGTLQLVEGEYRLQTRESSEWDRDFRERRRSLTEDRTAIASDRTKALREAVTAALKPVALRQGDSLESRKLDIHFGSEPPSTNTGNIPVWVRDGWSVAEKGFVDVTREYGTDSPIVFVYLPRRDNDALDDAIASVGAASSTLSTRGYPSTPEGQEARAAMETRLAGEKRRLSSFVTNVIDQARVYQGGGTEVVDVNLAASVRKAAERSLERLFPEFGPADHANWGKVLSRATDGSSDPLAPVDYSGDVDKHPVCAMILQHVGLSGKRGSDVRKHFGAAPYGWPQDAIDGALVALLGGGFLIARQSGHDVPARGLKQNSVGVIEFRAEAHPPTARQRIGVKSLLSKDFNIIASVDSELADAAGIMLDQLRQLAMSASGPAPLPAPPDVEYIDNLRAESGNRRVIGVYDQRERIQADRAEWDATAEKIAARRPQWELILSLVQKAGDSPIAASVAEQISAIQLNRSLLHDPDPIKPLLDEISSDLRTRLLEARESYEGHRQEAIEELQSSSDWARLSTDQQESILRSRNLLPVAELRIGTADELLASLVQTSLSDWKTRTMAITGQKQQALADVAAIFEPDVIQFALPRKILSSEDDVNAYVDALRRNLLEVVSGNPVLLT